MTDAALVNALREAKLTGVRVEKESPAPVSLNRLLCFARLDVSETKTLIKANQTFNGDLHGLFMHRTLSSDNAFRVRLSQIGTKLKQGRRGRLL
jgi:hypothetical protein